MALGIGFQPVAGLENRAFLANARQHIGERLARRMVIERIGGGEQRRPRPDRELGQLTQTTAFVAAIGKGGRQIDASSRMTSQRVYALLELRCQHARRDDDEDLTFACGSQLFEGEMALAFDGAPVAQSEQTA